MIPIQYLLSYLCKVFLLIESSVDKHLLSFINMKLNVYFSHISMVVDVLQGTIWLGQLLNSNVASEKPMCQLIITLDGCDLNVFGSSSQNINVISCQQCKIPMCYTNLICSLRVLGYLHTLHLTDITSHSDK